MVPTPQEYFLSFINNVLDLPQGDKLFPPINEQPPNLVAYLRITRLRNLSEPELKYFTSFYHGDTRSQPEPAEQRHLPSRIRRSTCALPEQLSRLLAHHRLQG